MTTETLRVGIVGCGRVAEAHLRFLTLRRDTEVIAVADTSRSAAERLASRFQVSRVCTSLEELLDGQSIHVLHVLTPPAFHTEQVLAAVERGIHVLVEKPLALNPVDANRIYERAAARQVIVCPDFIQLFHPRMVEVTRVIESGRFGRVVHCEVHLGLDLNIAEVREARGLHWMYSLPGGVLQNYLTHPLYLVLRWIGKLRGAHVLSRSFGSLPQHLADHLDVLIDGELASGHVTLSVVAQPGGYSLKIFCERATVVVNFEALTTTVETLGSLPPPFARLLSSPRLALQLLHSTGRNIWARLRGRLVPYHGLGVLIDRLYASIRTGTPPPISPELALAVSQAEHEVLTNAGKVALDLSPRPGRQSRTGRMEAVLVTGAAGYLGIHVVRKLVARGCLVRAFVRPLSRIDELEQLGVEIRFGDLRDERQVFDAAAGIDVIVHVGAALRGSPEFIRTSTVQGTANIAKAAQGQGVRRVVYISSLAVYDYSSLRNGCAITAKTALEARPTERGVASEAKRHAEDIALACLHNPAPVWSILRPSVLFGGGREPLSFLGVRRGRWLACFASPRSRLRLVHVADVAEAVWLTMRHNGGGGRIYTVSHPESVTYREYLDFLPRQVRSSVRVAFIPQWVVRGAGAAGRFAGWLRGRSAGLTRRRIAYLYRDLLVDAGPIQSELGWQPAADLRTQIAGAADLSEVTVG